jgi:histidine kinase
MRKVKKREAINEEVLKTMAEEIDSHVDRASKIINHLREFGRKSDVMKEPIQVNEAMNRACEMFDQQLKLREIKVVKELHADLPLVLADANRLEQIFINLLVNARDAIEEKLERGDDGSAKKEIELKSFEEDGKVVVEIGDSGIGIPETIRDKIFEPFFTTKKVGQGTGLGLSISYGIVQDYDGVIRVESRENEGSKFTVTFPIMAAA